MAQFQAQQSAPPTNEDEAASAIYSEPLYSYPATPGVTLGPVAPPSAAPTLRMDSNLTLICDNNQAGNLGLYGTLPRGYARGSSHPRPALGDQVAKGGALSKSSLYLFEGTPTTNAATFFSKESDDVFESSHYKQVLDPRALSVDPRTLGYATLSRQGPFRATTNLLCGPMVPSAGPGRPVRPTHQSPGPSSQPNSSSSGKQPLSKKKSVSLEKLVEEEVPELDLESDPETVPRSALKSEKAGKALTVTFVDPGAEREVEEMESTPRRFFQALMSPVRKNSLGMECEPERAAQKRPWTALLKGSKA